jgi:zinc transport system permease protein
MMADFIWRALAAAVGVAAVAGPLGCFVVWRRMAYFGDSLSHNALLGVLLGLVLGIEPTFGVVVTSCSIAVLLWLMQRQHSLPSDTILGLLAHSGLAISLVVMSFFEGLRLDLLAYLFGDVLAVTYRDLVWIYLGGSLALLVLVLLWRPLLLATVHEDLALAEGLPVRTVRLVFVLLVALVIAAAMKVVGLLLITSLLIIPAACAGQFARSPEQMAASAAAVGALSAVFGIFLSLFADSPPGPSIVVVMVVFFVLGLCLRMALLYARRL